MDQEFPAIIWVSGFVFLVAAVWLTDFGERSEAKRRGPVILYGTVVVLVWLFLDDAIGATGPVPIDNSPTWQWMTWGASALLLLPVTRRFGFPGFAAALILCALLYPADPSQGFDLWESDGERAIRTAKAREIELEAEARYQRELALLRAAGHAPEPAETGPDLLPWLLLAIAGGAVGFAWVQTLRADRSGYRIRELEQRLYIAERRDALPDLRETSFRAFKGMDR